MPHLPQLLTDLQEYEPDPDLDDTVVGLNEFECLVSEAPEVSQLVHLTDMKSFHHRSKFPPQAAANDAGGRPLTDIFPGLTKLSS